MLVDRVLHTWDKSWFNPKHWEDREKKLKH
jgi:hypothetical protein